VFAPVAAHLARGAGFGELGPTLSDPVRLPSARCRVGDGLATGAVMHVDRFGNGLTSITAEALSTAFPGVSESDLEVEVVSRTITGLTRSYGDAAFGALVAILGSSGRLEISQVGGDASSRLGFGPGDRAQVRVRRPQPEKRG
jgi:S-adenosylmethionine hydrolase